MFYLTTHSTHFIYGYMASDIWLRTILIVRKETRCRHIGYSYLSIDVEERKDVVNRLFLVVVIIIVVFFSLFFCYRLFLFVLGCFFGRCCVYLFFFLFVCLFCFCVCFFIYFFMGCVSLFVLCFG